MFLSSPKLVFLAVSLSTKTQILASCVAQPGRLTAQLWLKQLTHSEPILVPGLAQRQRNSICPMSVDCGGRA